MKARVQQAAFFVKFVAAAVFGVNFQPGNHRTGIIDAENRLTRDLVFFAVADYAQAAVFIEQEVHSGPLAVFPFADMHRLIVAAERKRPTRGGGLSFQLPA